MTAPMVLFLKFLLSKSFLSRLSQMGYIPKHGRYFLTPPPQLSLVTNVGNAERQYLQPNQIAILNVDTNVRNARRMPLQLDLRAVADEIGGITC